MEKRAEIERRLEDAARREKAELRQQRSDMFAQRKRKQQEVRLIEMKMARVKEVRGETAAGRHCPGLLRAVESRRVEKHADNWLIYMFSPIWLAW